MMTELSLADLIREHDAMGRLLAWLVDPRHDVPKVTTETRDYIKSYMRDVLSKPQ